MTHHCGWGEGGGLTEPLRPSTQYTSGNPSLILYALRILGKRKKIASRQEERRQKEGKILVEYIKGEKDAKRARARKGGAQVLRVGHCKNGNRRGGALNDI